MKELLKVKGKTRLYDDVEMGITYKTTLVYTVGKKGEPLYRKFRLMIEEGAQDFYGTVEPGDDVIVEFKPTVPKKLDEYQEDP